VLVAKAIAERARATQLLPFKGAVMGAPSGPVHTLAPDQLIALSRLPARDVLYGRLVGVVAAPVGGLVRTLNALIGGLAVALGQVREQKASEPAAEAAAAEPARDGSGETDAPEAAAAAVAEDGAAAAEAEADAQVEGGAEAATDSQEDGETQAETDPQTETEAQAEGDAGAQDDNNHEARGDADQPTAGGADGAPENQES
jgi:large subunit ribosomal protein L10